MKYFKFIHHNLYAAPFLLSISFVLSNYLRNQGELLPMAVAGSLFIALISCLLIEIIFALLVKDRTKRIFSVTTLLLFAYTYGEIIYYSDRVGLTEFTKPAVLYPLWSAALILSFFLIYKTKKNLATSNKFIFILSIFAVMIPSLTIISFERRRMIFHSRIKKPVFQLEIDKSKLEHELPDIYYILPDSYTSSAVLKRVLNYDNSGFVKYLEQRGFYVPAAGTSNYPVTYLSLTSTLNMEYVDYLSVDKTNLDKTVVFPLINDNNVKKFLGNLGYKYYQLGSWCDLTNHNPSADSNFISRNAEFDETDYFNFYILHTTLVAPVLESFFPAISISQKRANVRTMTMYQLDQLPEIAKMAGPKFVFTHLLAPHEPYVLGPECELAMINKKVEELYTDQVSCINRKLQATIDRIIQNSKTPPVILIQSDEGMPDLNLEKSAEDAWEEADDRMLQKKFPIFTAYYLPGVSTSSLYSSISNVNSFRTIFNLYFSAGLPLLPDKNYIIPNVKNLYDFIEVTDRVKKN